MRNILTALIFLLGIECTAEVEVRLNAENMFPVIVRLQETCNERAELAIVYPSYDNKLYKLAVVPILKEMSKEVESLMRGYLENRVGADSLCAFLSMNVGNDIRPSLHSYAVSLGWRRPYYVDSMTCFVFYATDSTIVGIDNELTENKCSAIDLRYVQTLSTKNEYWMRWMNDSIQILHGAFSNKMFKKNGLMDSTDSEKERAKLRRELNKGKKGSKNNKGDYWIMDLK